MSTHEMVPVVQQLRSEGGTQPWEELAASTPIQSLVSMGGSPGGVTVQADSGKSLEEQEKELQEMLKRLAEEKKAKKRAEEE